MSKAAILLYHRVARLPSDRWRMAVSPEHFGKQLDVLAASFTPLPLTELVQALQAKDVPDRAVTVTFDDGYRDVLLAAEPALERRAIPATVFVVSGAVGSGRDFWWDDLERLVQAGTLDDYNAWHAKLQALPERERRATLEELTSPLPVVEPATLSAHELRLLAESPLVEIGAHTVTHPALGGLSPESTLEELRTSKEQLEEIVGRPVKGFSYPYGVYDTETAKRVRTAGFAYSCTSERRAATPGDDPFQLPRVHVDDLPGAEFEARLSNVLGMS